MIVQYLSEYNHFPSFPIEILDNYPFGDDRGRNVIKSNDG